MRGLHMPGGGGEKKRNGEAVADGGDEEPAPVGGDGEAPTPGPVSCPPGLDRYSTRIA